MSTAMLERKQKIRHLTKVIFVRGDYKRNYDNKIIIVDNVDGVPQHTMVSEPKITFYVDKEETDDGITRLYRSLDEVEIVRDVPYKDLKEELAYYTQNENALRNAKQNGGQAVSDLIKRMSGESNIHGSDVNIEDHYISRWCDKYSQEMTIAPKLHKAYLDIEVDDYHQKGMSRPGSAYGTIDLISLYSDKNNRCYTHILKTKDNPQIVTFIDKCEEHKRRLEDRFKFTWVPRFYDKEDDLICDIFDTINAKNMRPDFVSMWNAGYDYRMMQERLDYHGINPADVICPEGFPHPKEYYWEDKNQKVYDPATRGDYIQVNGFTNYLCQMLTFASIRANEPNRDSLKLGDILEEFLGDSKDEVPVPIRQFSRYDFARYLEYNVNDAYKLHSLEEKIQDISLLYSIAMITRTRFHKALKKTTSLRNLAQKFMLDSGIVISNNHNVVGFGDTGEKTKFEGAFVLNPDTVAHIGEMILGKRSNRIFRGVGDADMTSMYPLILLYCMMDPSNQVGRVLLKNMAGELVTNEMVFDFLRRDNIKFGNKWFGLPNKEQILRKILSV